MSFTLFEIVVLEDGEVALQRADEEDTPLIRISFSDEAHLFMQDAKLNIAKAMIDAGIEAFEQLGEKDGESEIVVERGPRVLH